MLTLTVVFLAEPANFTWESIPVPKVRHMISVELRGIDILIQLGDLGCALESQPPNYYPPSTTSRGVGTPGYRAPVSAFVIVDTTESVLLITQ